jgi:hypothetical protein
MSKALESFKGLKIGQKFKVVRNIGSHNYPMGVTLVFKVDGVESSSMNNIAAGGDYNNIRIDEIEVFNDTLAEMRSRRDELSSSKNAEIKELNKKIKTCEELGLDVYDQMFISVYRALESINSKATLLEKTQVVLSIIKSI